jgi:pyruvate dehydrogenase E2 component (dihydrolipoamide acetyltransferase)
MTASAPISITGGAGYSDFELSDMSRAMAARLTATKLEVPHYYLSVELDLTKLLALRAELNTAPSSSGGISVTDCLVKAAALAMRAVPDVNASWMGTFVRQYEQVDVNLVMGAGSFVCAPVIRDAASKGLGGISREVQGFEDDLFADDAESSGALQSEAMAVGTFSLHDLGVYGVKSASPIVLAPQVRTY